MKTYPKHWKIYEFINSADYYPYAKLSKEIQENPRLLSDLDKKFNDELCYEATYLENRSTYYQKLYLTNFVPNGDPSFFINGASYNTFEDIRDNIGSQTDGEDYEYKIIGKYINIADGEVTWEDKEIKTASKAMIQHVAFQFFNAQGEIFAMYDPVYKELILPKNGLEEIFFDIVAESKMSEFRAATSPKTNTSFELFPPPTPGF